MIWPVADSIRFSPLYIMIGVNYFFGLATTISPYQRQLPFDLAGAEARSPPARLCFSS
jgi:hypothetical protein